MGGTLSAVMIDRFIRMYIDRWVVIRYGQKKGPRCTVVTRVRNPTMQMLVIS